MEICVISKLPVKTGPTLWLSLWLALHGNCEVWGGENGGVTVCKRHVYVCVCMYMCAPLKWCSLDVWTSSPCLHLTKAKLKVLHYQSITANRISKLPPRNSVQPFCNQDCSLVL